LTVRQALSWIETRAGIDVNASVRTRRAACAGTT
jgi:hypothetical protein